MDEAAIRREMDIYGRLREIASPHILVVLDILREAGEYALVTEYADSGSLWDLLGGDEATDDIRKPLDETTVRTIAAEVLEGLTALHAHGSSIATSSRRISCVATTSGNSRTLASANS